MNNILLFLNKSTILILYFIIKIIINECIGKTYEPCELAKEMIEKHRFPSADIANWICLIRWESDFNTTSIGRLNSDGSLDHGLFQISDLYWCSNKGVDGACGIHCKDLENDDITDDSICARRIFRITKHKTNNGFDAWAGWKQHCQNENVNSYIANCKNLF